VDLGHREPAERSPRVAVGPVEREAREAVGILDRDDGPEDVEVFVCLLYTSDAADE